MKLICGKSDRVSVKIKEDILEEKLFACVRALKNVQLEAHVRIGNVVVQRILARESV